MAFRYHKYGIIISIDFGTTFSGTCYSVTYNLSNDDLLNKKYPDIIQVTSWPQQSNNENKTPSVNIYDRNFHLLHWGKAAREHIENGHLKPGQIVKERFKLDLPSSVPQKGAIYKTNNTKKIEHDNMRATIDYFREIFDYTVSAIQNNIGFAEKVSAEKEDIRFVITVPAQWNDVQRAIMRTVAKEAGLITDDDHENRLLIINESSAATLHCEIKVTGYDNMKPGDKYIICDAGGGTVDLATFESVKRTSDDPDGSYRRCQLTADSGDKCGSTFIDQKMRELLTKFCYGDAPPKDKEEEKMRDRLFSPAVDRFIKEVKVVFGHRSDKFKFPPCKHNRFLKGLKELNDLTGTKYEDKIKTYASEIPPEASGEGDPNDGQCLACKAEDFKFLFEENFGRPTIVKLEDAIIVPTLEYYLPDDVDCEVVGGTCKFTIPYDTMRRFVFHEVVKTTIDLIDRQIRKANGNIDRTYLVGGFGGSPYLRKMILRQFHRPKSSFPKNRFRCGKLIIDDGGNAAAMRGAMVYGIDGSRRKPQTDVFEEEYKPTTKDYNTLICLDIGYSTTSCSYKHLGNNSDDEYNTMTEIVEWPGLKKNNFMIPTAKKTVNNKTTWGALVDLPIEPDHEKLVNPSKLMSIVKADLRYYLRDYLQLVLGHVHQLIVKANPQLSDKNKYRYVITMENCYRFFNNKSEMRYIAQLAGIISKDDPKERLLLINRDCASAMYNEKEYFSEKRAYTNHFLQVNMYHDICHLALFESTKLSGKNIDSKDDEKTGHFRNVRSVRSATFDFDFISRIVSNLNNYVSNNVCIKCDANHSTYSPTYYTELKEGFLDYIKIKLNFNNNDETQEIPITKAGCCIASIKVYDLLEHVFRPAVKDLASEINRFATQTDMAQRFSFDNIFLSGTLLEAETSTYEFLQDIVVNNISETLNIQRNLILPSKENGKEALLGAALYGNRPADFTERVSRTTYAVNVCAYSLKDPSDKAKKDMAKEIAREVEKGSKDEKKNTYHAESTYGLVDLEKPVDLFYQSPHNPSLYNQDFDRKSNELSFFINRGDKIYEKDQKSGIFKKFYARETCIAYITIYCSDSNEVYKDRAVIDENFRKIHQFEVYVKYDEEDPMLNKDDPRLYFDVRFIPDNNEAKFEARVGSRLGKKIPEFRYRDEFLVANIYDDRQHIEVGDLTIGSASVDKLKVAESEN